MRQARLKPTGQAVFYHLYNRVSGTQDDRPFGEAEKEKFIQLLHKLTAFYTVRILAYQVMSNHFHLVVHAPAEPPAIDQICNRYRQYYGRPLDPSDPRCALFGERMRDISWFMHALEHTFSCWFNRSRPIRRRGSLWADRFKNTVLGDARAVWECCKYVEMNSVRAGIVSDPAAYRFSSYGDWCERGKHPFEENLTRILLPSIQGIYPFQTLAQVRNSLGAAFTEAGAKRKQGKAEPHTFRLTLDQRTRCWVDGIVIGSELYVLAMMARHRKRAGLQLEKPVRAETVEPGSVGIFCGKKLRAV